ncbi:type II secretion system F family protein [Bifidobacterium pullorum subsp. saeculare]|uniref:Type II secretion system F family protein n=1 Tax=Bifidobacterium pullorum subsp. saeculare TaxID=78257 RepID=A0A938WXP8_9BIFI|nr:type II secretion system F family protein [Bifidobacterium pullorum]MBM6699194.1 type II secretion system F family protein [Bifidobacterium pullorum subsp. saeculare]
MLTVLAAGAAAGAVWLWLGRRRHAGSRVREPPLAAGPGTAASESAPPSDVAETMLALEMLRVAVAQGASLSHALDAVGGAVGGELGASLAHASRALDRGVPWHEAWVGAQGGATSGVTAVLERTLETSWTHGASPVQPLALAAERLDQDERAAIERTAGKLTVRLLLPTGLCFLPAFVFIGVIPAIASFVW